MIAGHICPCCGQEEEEEERGGGRSRLHPHACALEVAAHEADDVWRIPVWGELREAVKVGEKERRFIHTICYYNSLGDDAITILWVMSSTRLYAREREGSERESRRSRSGQGRTRNRQRVLIEVQDVEEEEEEAPVSLLPSPFGPHTGFRRPWLRPALHSA